MIKKLVIFTCCLMSFSSFASAMLTCGQALPTNDAGFCPSFRIAAECYCKESGAPAFMCKDMEALYKRMISYYGSQLKACQSQKNTSTQTCMDDWNCYRKGGKDSLGRSCSSTGKKC